MSAISQLIHDYSLRLRPLSISDRVGIDALPKTFASFQSDVASLSGIEDDVVVGLTSLLTDREWRREALWITAAGVRPSPAYVPALCALLSVRDAYLQHEWIADILGEIRSEDAIHALRDACSFDIPSDPSRQLACRCLGALWTIGSPDAFDAIRSQLRSPWPEVREEAERLLEIAA